MPDTQANIARREAAFQTLQHAAANGLRCPKIEASRGIRRQDYRALAEEGRIIIHVHGRNWWVVGILEGPCLGKWTARDPDGGLCYRIVDRNGARPILNPKKPVGRQGVRRNQPSAPRLLSRDSDEPRAGRRDTAGPG